MKRSKNNTWLLILMIISQTMLTGLLVQWLRSQWEDEKESLHKDISQKFMESVNQVVDSMLVKHLIVPVLNDSTVNEDHLITFNKSLSRGNYKAEHNITAFYKDTDSQKQTMVTITLPDSSGQVPHEDLAFSSFDSTEKNILLRSVKLIIRQTGDSTGNGNHLSHMISVIPDTILLKKLFEHKLEDAKPGFNIMWVSDSAKNKSGIRGPIMLFRTNIFEKPLNVEVLKFQGAIFRRISSQIIFAFTLLMCTGAAFFFTYRSLKKQEMLNTLRNDFISNISHELKTPVSTVSVALEALKNFDRIRDPAKSNEYLDIAYREMKRLDQLITQVLNASVLEDHGGYIKLEKADLVGLTREVLNSMQARIIRLGARVEFRPSEKIINAGIDKLYIHGVLNNLLDNSLKYCSEKPEIIIAIEQAPSSVILKIGDNGPGIQPEYISRIFEKFFRVPKGDIHDVKGYGLGLSFADQVMKLHSGTIGVRNKNEGGCEFTLTFPKNEK